jgi:hypothetical protein
MISSTGFARLVSAMGSPVRAWAERIDRMALRPLASAAFVGDGRPALLVWAALLTHPRLATGAVIGLVAGHAVKNGFLPSTEAGVGGGVVTNALLAAVACMWLTQGAQLPIMAELVLAAGIASAAAVMAVAFEKTFEGTGIPPLGLGYVVIAGALFIVFPLWAQQAVTLTDWGPPPDTILKLAGAFARSLGSLFFMPDPLAGTLIGFAILLWSRVGFLFGMIGWLSGLVVSAGFLGLGERFYWLPISYAFFLAGMALATSFFVPSRAGLAVAAGAGGFAALFGLVLQFSFAWSPAAYLPLPLILTCWIGIQALRAERLAPLLAWNDRRGSRPETCWLPVALFRSRWRYTEPLLTVPLAGMAQITQGFDSSPSHQGPWRFAVDFQRPLHAESPESNRSSLWKEPVYSPVAGIVERAQNTVPDNPLGVVNYSDNFGNYVVIRTEHGAFVTLAHLAQGSIAVHPGSLVSHGSYLGLVGNSGRSPVPHLHMQVQTGPDPTSPTIPFALANCLSTKPTTLSPEHWHARMPPVERAVVAASVHNPMTYTIMTGHVAGNTLWSCSVSGSVPRLWRQSFASTTVRLDRSIGESGNVRFRTPDASACLVGSFAADAWRMDDYQGKFSPLLVAIALGLASVPYAAQPGIRWTEIAPVPSLWWGRHIPHIAGALSAAPLARLELECTACDQQQGLAIVSTLLEPSQNLPERVNIRVVAMKGPVEIHAIFPSGTMHFELVSFDLPSISED